MSLLPENELYTLKEEYCIQIKIDKTRFCIGRIHLQKSMLNPAGSYFGFLNHLQYNINKLCQMQSFFMWNIHEVDKNTPAGNSIFFNKSRTHFNQHYHHQYHHYLHHRHFYSEHI
jgi:hypothetical protein